jgi:tyrosinase
VTRIIQKIFLLALLPLLIIHLHSYRYEEALRQKIPSVVLPYWDSTMDFDMDDPTKSVIWSRNFLGNGDGNVREGPFANWTVLDTGPLTREIGFFGSLFSKENVAAVLTRNRTEEITIPNAQFPYDLEGFHGGVHNWVGGQIGHMSFISFSSFDPVFYMHHAYVDYVWEQFRSRQRRLGINPSTDYPEDFGTPLHAPNRTMDWFPWFQQIDGYSDLFTSLIYQYAPAPTCSRRFPTCRSTYLTCDRSQYRCVGVAVPRPDIPRLTAPRLRRPSLSGPRFDDPR